MKRTRYMFNFERYYGKIFKKGTAIVKKSEEALLQAKVHNFTVKDSEKEDKLVYLTSVNETDSSSEKSKMKHYPSDFKVISVGVDDKIKEMID